MKNIWLDINLSDYENHMSLPGVAQAQYLSDYFADLLKSYNPKSIAIFGCSGGNGLEQIDKTEIEKVICVDINSNFLNEAEKRFKNNFNSIEFICIDITSDNFKISYVDFIYCGLVFEYVSNEAVIRNVAKSLNFNGILAVVLQQPNDRIPEVSPSKYKSLEKLSQIFNFVSPIVFIELCGKNGLTLISEKETELKSGKSFTELIFRKN